jgi:diguanylate cyclase (GGDEF)-like protein
MYRDRLQARIRAGQNGIALFLIDLDRFKSVNDTRGHRTGDLLLEQVARRLTTAIRPGRYRGRLGGDEFAVIATGIHDEAAAAELAGRC